jgi:DNA-binding CsgD family transcriptional regulator
MTADIDDANSDERRLRPVVLLVLALVAVGSAVDIYLDGPTEWASLHVVMELALMVVSASVGLMLLRNWRNAESALAVSERTRTAVEADRSAWQARAEQALQGMAKAIDGQFDAWQLTPAEREVALALLQGLGHKQIAYRTNRSESTVRQHAVSVYGKSGQAGRAELAAFFLGGLMLPASETPPQVNGPRQG